MLSEKSEKGNLNDEWRCVNPFYRGRVGSTLKQASQLSAIDDWNNDIQASKGNADRPFPIVRHQDECLREHYRFGHSSACRKSN